MSTLLDIKLSYQNDLFEVNIYEESEKNPLTIVEEVKFDGDIIHTVLHQSPNKEYSQIFAKERLEACKSSVVLTFLLFKYANKYGKKHLKKIGEEFLLASY